MIGISACLCGQCCRYDGNHNAAPELVNLAERGQAVVVCPEVLGGLSTPRYPAEIQAGNGSDVWAGTARVVDNQGNDVTEAFKAGAILAYRQLKAQGISIVILKERSPSCGSGSIYDGSFFGRTVAGAGVTTAYLRAMGMLVYSEENWAVAKAQKFSQINTLS